MGSELDAIADAPRSDAESLAAHIDETVASYSAGALPDDAAILVLRVPDP